MKTKARLKHILESLEEIGKGNDLAAAARVPIRNATVLIRLALTLLNSRADETKGHD